MSSSTSNQDIDTLIANLGDHNGLVRKRARLDLKKIGESAIPALIETLTGSGEHARWEAAKVLSQIGDPTAVPTLIETMQEDEDLGIRWLASEGLIKSGSQGLTSLLEALIQHPDSIWLRQGAIHILHTLASEESLHDFLTPVLAALKSVEPTVEVSVAAHAALTALQN